MRQVVKGNKRYISDNAKMYSPNLSGKRSALYQIQRKGTKIHWFMVLARGVVHVSTLRVTSLDSPSIMPA